MFEKIHRQEINGELYEYPAIKSATKVKNKYISIMRTYGNKRTKQEAIELVKAWELEHMYRHRKNKT